MAAIVAHAWTRTRIGEALPPAFLVGTGLLAAVTALFEILTETTFVGASPGGGLIEFLLLFVPAVGLVYAGYWLQVGEFDPRDVWRIGAFGVGGAVVAAVATIGLLVVGPAPVMDASATFVLFVATATEGSLLGVLAGSFATTDRLFRQERSAAAEFQTLQALLRHDLRNRLTIIGGHLTRLAEATDAPADSVATIEAQLEAIEALLDDTRLATEAIRTEASVEPVDLIQVIRRRVSLLEESYDAVSVSTALPDAAFVPADDLLGSVLDNLLSNAVVHSDRPTPEIAVSVEATADLVRLAVADNGPGIPAERREAMFDPGVGEGTGMGLYLVRTVIERYGGEVAIEGNEPRGTVVTVTLPRVAA